MLPSIQKHLFMILRYKKNTMLVFKEQEEAVIKEPIGIEYIIK